MLGGLQLVATAILFFVIVNGMADNAHWIRLNTAAHKPPDHPLLLSYLDIFYFPSVIFRQ